jgi:hypothetical protein
MVCGPEERCTVYPDIYIYLAESISAAKVYLSTLLHFNDMGLFLLQPFIRDVHALPSVMSNIHLIRILNKQRGENGTKSHVLYVLASEMLVNSRAIKDVALQQCIHVMVYSITLLLCLFGIPIDQVGI